MERLVGVPPITPIKPFPLTTITQLVTALAKAKPGTTIRLATVDFIITQSLIVPDDVALEGMGDIDFDSEGRPKKFGVPARLLADPSLAKDIVVLRNGASLKAVAIHDVAGRQGNLVAVYSTKPDDVVSAVIENCEFYNPNLALASPAGPIGRSLIVLTANPGGSSPHTGARITAVLKGSMTRAPEDGSAVFAANFAPRGQVIIQLERNVIGGGIDATGGVTRFDPVTDARTIISSAWNVYEEGRSRDRDGQVRDAGIGWALRGASNPPIPSRKIPSTNGNTLVFSSANDRVLGYGVGIHAAGGARPYSNGGEVNANRAYLTLINTIFDCVDADVELVGAESDVSPGGSGFTPGDDNQLYVTLHGVTASGKLENSLKNSATYEGKMLAPSAAGSGNRVELLGEVPFSFGVKAVLKVPSGS